MPHSKFEWKRINLKLSMIVCSADPLLCVNFVIALIQVKVLRSMRALQIEDVVVGQYKGHNKGGKSYPAYTDDPTVPSGSLTPTFAAAALFIDNARWDGVPFLMKAGEALNTRRYVQPSFRELE